jgi:hypothetical protein
MTGLSNEFMLVGFNRQPESRLKLGGGFPSLLPARRTARPHHNKNL